MSGLPLPRNAWRIVEARRQGKKPELPVFISYVGDIPSPNPTVYCDSGVRYEWNWLSGLTTYVAVKAGVNATDAFCAAWLHMRMVCPTLIDYEREQLACIVLVNPLRLWQVRRDSHIWRDHFE